jgi:hypothetical protein
MSQAEAKLGVSDLVGPADGTGRAIHSQEGTHMNPTNDFGCVVSAAQLATNVLATYEADFSVFADRIVERSLEPFRREAASILASADSDVMRWTSNVSEKHSAPSIERLPDLRLRMRNAFRK